MIRRKRTYVLGFVLLFWIAIAAIVGLLVGLNHLLKNTTATIVVFQLVIYSWAIGFMASQLYKSKYEKCRSINRERGWAGSDRQRQTEADDCEDSTTGWKVPNEP